MRAGPWAAGLAALFLLGAGSVQSARRFAGDWYFQKGKDLLVLRQRKAAAVALERAHRLDPGRSDIARRLGDLYREWYEDQPAGVGGRTPAEARTILQKAAGGYLAGIDAIPGDAWCWAGLGETYSYFGALQEPLQLDLGRFSLPRRDRLAPADRAALAALDRAIALEPNGYDTRDQKALHLDALGLHDEAIAEYRRSAELMPLYYQHPWPPPGRLVGDVGEAILDGMNAALTTNRFVGRDEMLRNIGETASQRGEWERAEAALNEGIAVARDASFANVLRYLLAETLMRQGKDEKALDEFGKALAEPVVAAAVRMNRGILLMRLKRFDEAFSELRLAVALKPQDPWIRLLASSAAEATGRDAVALESLRIAASLAPADPEPQRRLYDFFMRRANRSEAAVAARRLVAGWPAVADYRRMLDEAETGTP